MATTNVQNLTEAFNSENSDRLVFFSLNEYKDLLSKKSAASNLSSYYLLKTKTNFFSDIDKLKLSAQAAFDSLTAYAATFATKEFSDDKFGLKQTIENKRPSFLDTGTKDSIIAKFTNKDKIEAAGAQARETAHQYADEMTDFTAAALVGIRMGDGIAEELSAPSGDNG